VYAHPSLVSTVLPSEEKSRSRERSPLHWFFRIELADGELYALDLCTAQFASTAGRETLSCVAPLHEHLQRLPLSQKSSMTMELHLQQRALNMQRPTLAPEEVMAGKMSYNDMCSIARQFAVLELKKVIQGWTISQPLTLSNVLRLPMARFVHAFCTLVWPIELMARQEYARNALMTLNFIRKFVQDATGPDDYE
jgi:hypothetical protein